MEGTFALTWPIENRVLLVSITGNVTLDLFKAIDRTLTMALDNAQPPMYIIAHISDAHVHAKPFDVLNAMRFTQHPHLGRFIIVGPNRLARFVASVVFQLRSANVSFAQDDATALDQIRKQDSSIASPV